MAFSVLANNLQSNIKQPKYDALQIFLFKILAKLCYGYFIATENLILHKTNNQKCSKQLCFKTTKFV